MAFGFAWGPIGWLVPSEIHDLNTRSAGQSITVFTQLISGAIVTQCKHTAIFCGCAVILSAGVTLSVWQKLSSFAIVLKYFS